VVRDPADQRELALRCEFPDTLARIHEVNLGRGREHQRNSSETSASGNAALQQGNAWEPLNS
jgi:hypothetical protein